LIEFIEEPTSMEGFVEVLDTYLQENNSDYSAKRKDNMLLQKPVVHSVKSGTFDAWLESIGKLGGQNKVPRLSNDRKMIEEIKKQFS